MFENIKKFLNKIRKKEEIQGSSSKNAAKERLHLVLMQDRANVSADFLELMKQEIIDVIKKYIEIDESAIDVRLTNKDNGDGTKGAPALYANIPIVNIKDETRKKAQTNVTIDKEIIIENTENTEDTENDANAEIPQNTTNEINDQQVFQENETISNNSEMEILHEAEEYIENNKETSSENN